MARNVKTYNPKEINIAFGSHIVTGYAEDSFVSIEPSGDGTTKKVGADGEVTRSISPDRTFSVKVTVDQMSESNSYFQEMYNRDQQTGDAIEPLMVQDMKGGMLFSADEAWIPKPSTHGFGKAAGTREWEIHTGPATLDE